MVIDYRPELTPEERALPLSRYYDLPLHSIGPLFQQIIDHGPLRQDQCLEAKDWKKHFQLPGRYDRPVFGYRTMDDGTGFLATYSLYTAATPKMLQWYFRWINIPSKNQPKGVGNLRYKIWCPPCHITHGFVNGKDKFGGVYTVEALQLNKEAQDFCFTVRTHVDLRELGLSEEEERKLNEAGVWIDPAVETFYEINGNDYEHLGKQLGGSHLCLTMSRPCPTGGMEKVTLEWIGYGVKDGKIWRDESTPEYMFSEDWLRMALIHTTTEAQQLGKFLPELYGEYADKPDDAD